MNEEIDAVLPSAEIVSVAALGIFVRARLPDAGARTVPVAGTALFVLAEGFVNVAYA